MRANARCFFLVVLALGLTGARPASADEDDLKGIPSRDLKAGKDEHKRFFLVGPPKGAKAPKRGFGLVVILPGGDGSAEFHPFVKRIYKYALPEGYLAAQPVAVKWEDDQETVWPTARDRVKGMKFTTEEFVAGVLAEVGKLHKVDPQRVFTLSWSSSGPAAYAVALKDRKVRGSFIAMSVFKPDSLPPLKGAKGRAFYLYHSPADRVCPYFMARDAVKKLKAQGARMELKSYAGGHGWRGDVFGDIRTGVEWLEKQARKKAGE